MNERIRQLARQSGLIQYDTDGKMVDVEKFAELIIQECLLSLEPDPMAPEIDYAVEEKFYQRSAKKIKRHFGIKE